MYTYTNIYKPHGDIVWNEEPDNYQTHEDLFVRCRNEKACCYQSGNPTNCMFAGLNPIRGDPFIVPMVFRATEGRYKNLPDDRQKLNEQLHPKYGTLETYLHVYGKLETIYLAFRNPDQDAIKFTEPATIISFVAQLQATGEVLNQGNLCGLVAAKLVYKALPKASCLGPQFMVKLYFGGSRFTSPNTLKKLLHHMTNCPFLPDCINSAIPVHSEWLTARQATACGEIQVNRVYLKRDSTKKQFKYVAAHYNDIEPFTGHRHEIEHEEADMVFKHFVKKVQEAISQECTTVTARHLFRTRIALLTSTAPDALVPQPSETRVWTYKAMVRYLLDPLVKDVKNTNNKEVILSTHIDVFDELYGKNGSNEEWLKMFPHFVLDVIRFRDTARRVIKNLWIQEVDPKHFPKSEAAVAAVQVKITELLRVLSFDLETSYVPASREPQKIICIGSTLYDQGGYDLPYEHRLYVWISEKRVREVIRHEDHGPEDKEYTDQPRIQQKIIEFIEGNSNYQTNITKNTFFIHTFYDYEKMLSAFMTYVRSTRPAIVSGFNIMMFDLPKLITELEEIRFEGMRPYIGTKSSWLHTSRRQNFPLSFTYRKDIIRIKYAWKKAANSNKMEGRRRYIQNAATKYAAVECNMRVEYDDAIDMNMFTIDELRSNAINKYGANALGIITEENACNEQVSGTQPRLDREAQFIDGRLHANDLVDIEDMLGEPDEYLNRSEMENPYKPMVEARDIRDLLAGDIAFLDIMLEAGDRNRGITLDTAMRVYLNLHKLDETAVSPANLTATWREGDLPLLLAYCQVDVIGTVLVDRELKKPLFYMGCSRINSLTVRELYGNDMTVPTLCARYRLGFWRGLLEPDCNSRVDRAKIYQPNYEYKDSDFCLLKPRAGRTVDGTTGFYNRHIIPTFDFSGQYVMIMIAYNMCTGAMIPPKDLHRFHPNQYDTWLLQNVVEQVQHVKKGTKSHSFQSIYKVVSKDVHFVKATDFLALSAQLSTEMKNERERYKDLMNQANAAGDKKKAALYNNLQLACKVRGNGQFGILLLLDSMVGGAITQIGREQNEAVASYVTSEDIGMRVVNADTDSVMAVDKRMSLAPMLTDVPGVSFRNSEEDSRGGCISQLFINLGIQESKLFRKFDMLMNALEKRYTGIASVLNNGVVDETKSAGRDTVYVRKPSYRRPCNLEYEKLYFYKYFYEKKSYFGLKMIPGQRLKYHVAGLTGIKADRTIVKSIGQILPAIMGGEQDFEGCLHFMACLFWMVTSTMRAKEIAEHAVTAMCNKIERWTEDVIVPDDPNKSIQIRDDFGKEKTYKRQEILAKKAASEEAYRAMSEFDDRNGEEELFLQHGGKFNWLPLDYMLAHMKVGNLTEPKTVPTHKQIANCKRKGMPLTKAEKHVDFYQRSEVQVGGSFLKFCKTLLKGDEDDCRKERRQRVERLWFESEQKWDQFARNRSRTMERAKEKAEQVKPTTVTGMPRHHLVSRSECAKVPEHVWLALHEFTRKITTTHSILQRERLHNFKDESLCFEQPPFMQDKRIVANMREDVTAILDRFSNSVKDSVNITPHYLPLWWYDESFCTSKWYDFVLRYTPIDDEIQQEVEPPSKEYKKIWQEAVSRLQRAIREEDVSEDEAGAIWYLAAHDETSIDLHSLRRHQLSQLKSEHRYYAIRTFGKHLPVFVAMLSQPVTRSGVDIVKYNEYNVLDTAKRRVPVDENCTYLFDMEAFDSQSRSTPYLVVSTDGKERYVALRDSFRRSKHNRFTFLMRNDLLEELMLSGHGRLNFRPKLYTSLVEVTGDGDADYKTTISIRYLRDDNRPVEMWDFATDLDVRSIKVKDLCELFNKRKQAEFEAHMDPFVVMSFHDDDCYVRVHPSTVHRVWSIPNSSEEYAIPFMRKGRIFCQHEEFTKKDDNESAIERERMRCSLQPSPLLTYIKQDVVLTSTTPRRCHNSDAANGATDGMTPRSKRQKRTGIATANKISSGNGDTGSSSSGGRRPKGRRKSIGESAKRKRFTALIRAAQSSRSILNYFTTTAK